MYRGLLVAGLLSATATIVPALPSAGATPASATAVTVPGPGDTTEPYGPYGFTTKGLGKTDSYGEPSLAVAPDGTHTVISTPGGGGVNYWYSGDDGSTFKTTTTTSANGGGDSELDFLPDGSLISADLEVTDSNVKVSHDFGATWNAGTAAGTEQDRQWFAHSPDGKTQYLVYHDFAAEAEFISKSTDGGLTWTTLPQDQEMVNQAGQAGAPGGLISPPSAGSNASLVDQGVNTFSGPLLIDPNGKDQYVVYSISDTQSNLNPTVGVPPFGPVHGIVVAHSSDVGSTWDNKYAVVAQSNPTDPSQEELTGTLFPWGFIDQAGNVYVIYNSNRGNLGTDKFHTYYVVSTDKGAHWSDPVKLDDLPINGPGSAIYNTGAAVSPGVVDFAWYESPDGTPSGASGTFTPHFAHVTDATTAHPTVTTQAITTVPNHHGGVCLQGILCGIGPGSSDRSLLDFFELAVNPKTGLAEIAYADNSRLTPANATDVTGEVVFAKQTLAAPTTTKTSKTSKNTTKVTTRKNKVKTKAVTSPTGGLAATGLSILVPLSAAALLTAALVLRRRRLSS